MAISRITETLPMPFFKKTLTMTVDARILAFISVIGALSPALCAASQGGGPREACAQDVQSFCSNDQSDPSRAQACLEEHYKEISDGCYTALKSAAATEDQPPSENDQGAAPSGNDYPPRSDQQGVMQRPPQQGGGPREACRNDAQNFCHDVQPGGGRIIQCLKDHFKEISDSCYQALQNMPAGGGMHSGNGGGRPQ